MKTKGFYIKCTMDEFNDKFRGPLSNIGITLNPIFASEDDGTEQLQWLTYSLHRNEGLLFTTNNFEGVENYTKIDDSRVEEFISVVNSVTLRDVDILELTERLHEEVVDSKELDVYNDPASWGMQSGVLLSYREAQLLINHINQQ